MASLAVTSRLSRFSVGVMAGAPPAAPSQARERISRAPCPLSLNLKLPPPMELHPSSRGAFPEYWDFEDWPVQSTAPVIPDPAYSGVFLATLLPDSSDEAPPSPPSPPSSPPPSSPSASSVPTAAADTDGATSAPAASSPPPSPSPAIPAASSAPAASSTPTASSSPPAPAAPPAAAGTDEASSASAAETETEGASRMLAPHSAALLARGGVTRGSYLASRRSGRVHRVG